MASSLDIALTVFFAIFVILDIAFNVILFLAIYKKRSLHTPMNLLILHLSVTDILTGVFIIPRHVLNHAITYPNTTSSDYICKLVTGGNFIWTSATAASGFLTIIALERFFAVVHPHKAGLRVTKSRLVWLAWACWISSFAFNLPSLLVLRFDHDLHFCMENWPEWASPKAYVAFAFFAGNSSVIAMYVLYSIILYSLWKKHKAVNEVSRAARINARKRVTRMLILMTVVHMICRTPNYTFYTLSYFDPDAQYGSTVYSFTVFLILINSASHPFFFCWYMSNLRREVLKVIPALRSLRCPSRLRVFSLASTDAATDTMTRESANESRAENKCKQMVDCAFSSGMYSDTDENRSFSENTPHMIKYLKYGAKSNELCEIEVNGSHENMLSPDSNESRNPTMSEGNKGPHKDPTITGDNEGCEDKLLHDRNEPSDPTISGCDEESHVRGTTRTGEEGYEHKIPHNQSKVDYHAQHANESLDADQHSNKSLFQQEGDTTDNKASVWKRECEKDDLDDEYREYVV